MKKELDDPRGASRDFADTTLNKADFQPHLTHHLDHGDDIQASNTCARCFLGSSEVW
jgi:hypothetical protein